MKTKLSHDMSIKLANDLFEKSKINSNDTLYISSGYKTITISVPYNAPGKITENVFQVGGAGCSAGFDCFVYLIDCAGKFLLIDAGTNIGADKIKNNISQLGFNINDIDKIFITHGHYDHADGVSAFKKSCKAEVIIHEKDIDAVSGKNIEKTATQYLGDGSFHDFHPDIIVNDGYNFKVNNLKCDVVHLPGHTPGNSGILIEINGKKILFAGDILGWMSEKWQSNLSELEKSIHKIINLKPDFYATGHGWYEEEDLEYQFKRMVAMVEDKVVNLVLTKKHKLF